MSMLGGLSEVAHMRMCIPAVFRGVGDVWESSQESDMTEFSDGEAEDCEDRQGSPLGLSQWKGASSRVEAGTSGFLSNSDSDRSVPAELGQESQAMSFLRNGTPLASLVV